MADTMTAHQRSQCMAAIKAKDTKPELLVRKYLFSKGLRYRLHVKKLTGKPDIVLNKYKTVIFIDGCFWHGHENCKYYKLPKSNIDYWSQKIRKNKARDVSASFVLKAEGWKVLRIWECEIRKPERREYVLEEIYKNIVGIASTYCIEATDEKRVAEPEIPYGLEEKV